MKKSKHQDTGNDVASAVGYLLRLLSRRDYTRAELTQRMTRRGIDPEAQQAALDRLGELDLLDDQRIAHAHVRSKAERKGRLALRQELKKRGIDASAVEEALAPLDEAQQQSAARGVLDKASWRFQDSDMRKNRSKAAAFLARRGFTGDVVREAIEERFPWDADDDYASDQA